MIRQIWYEGKKYIFLRRNLVLLLILSLLFVGMLVFMEWQVMIEREASENFFQATGGSFNEETKEKIQTEQDALWEKMYTADSEGNLALDENEILKKGIYGSTQIEEYDAMRKALDCIEVVEKRNRNMEILWKNREAGMGNAAVSDFYQKEDNHQLLNLIPLNCLVRHACFGWFSGAAVILFLGSAYSVEREKNILPVLSATSGGELSLYISKVFTGCILAVVISLYFFVLYMISQWLLLGIGVGDLSQPLFLVDGYELCASGLTVGGILMKQELFVLFVTVLLALITMALSRGIGRGIYARVTASILLLVGTGIDLINIGIYQNDFHLDVSQWYLVSAATFYKIMGIEKMVNPFSLIQVSYYFQQPRYVTMGAYQEPVYVFPIIVLAVMSGVLFMYLTGKRRK